MQAEYIDRHFILGQIAQGEGGVKAQKSGNYVAEQGSCEEEGRR